MDEIYEPYIKMLFGDQAVRTGFNMIVQDAGDGRILVVGQSSGNGSHPLQFGSKRTHVLAMGDMVFRPRLVFGSDEFRGVGLNGLAKRAFLDTDSWITRGDTIIDNESKLHRKG